MKIDLAAARAAMKRAIEEKGEKHVYEPSGENESCVNWFEDESGNRVPDCIVGHGINYWGALDVVSSAVGVQYAFTQIIEAGKDFEYTAAALRYLESCQSNQDDGHEWGESEEMAWNSIQNDIEEGYFNPDESRSGRSENYF